MRHLKSYKIFESASIDELEDNVRDILLELEDDGFQIVISRISKLKVGKNYSDLFLEIYIRRPYGSPDRVINDAPAPPSGKYPGNIFIWREIKDAIIRLNDWYYDHRPNNYSPGIDYKIESELAKIGIKYESESPFRMYNGGREFGIGWYKPEDFNKIGDYISFTNLKVIMKL